MSGGDFSPSACPVFKEDLLYFFYGRPAYRLDEESSIGISAAAPVVIILSPDLVKSGRRLFPFDSGAFAVKRYRKWMHGRMELSDFEMQCCDEAPQRHVAAFFGTNDDYLKAKARSFSAKPGDFEVESLIKMLTDTDISSADDRRIALELQVASSIALRSPDVLGIVLPEEQIEAEHVKSFVAKNGVGIQLFGYEMSPLKRASEYQALLEQKAAAAQASLGLR